MEPRQDSASENYTSSVHYQTRQQIERSYAEQEKEIEHLVRLLRQAKSEKAKLKEELRLAREDKTNVPSDSNDHTAVLHIKDAESRMSDKNLTQAGSAAQYDLNEDAVDLEDREVIHQTDYDQLYMRYAKLETDFHKAQESIRIAEQRAKLHEARLRKVEKETRLNLEALVEENEELRKRLKDSDIRADQLLQKAFTDGRWAPKPDTYFREQLYMIHQDVKYWAAQWTCAEFSLEHLSHAQKEEVHNFFSRFVASESGNQLPQAITNPHRKLESKLTTYLLTAALSHKLYAKFLGDMFFCLKPNHAEAIRGVFHKLSEVNTGQTAIWRSTVWRILNPPLTPTSSEHDLRVHRENDRHLQKLYDAFISDILNSPIAILLRRVSEAEAQQRAEAVMQIVKTVAEVATKLWTQQSLLQIFKLSNVRKDKISFSVTAEEMEPHPFSKVDLEDTSHDGRKILMVMRPGLIASDIHNEPQGNANQRRILAKAIVLLEER